MRPVRLIVLAMAIVGSLATSPMSLVAQDAAPASTEQVTAGTEDVQVVAEPTPTPLPPTEEPIPTEVPPTQEPTPTPVPPTQEPLPTEAPLPTEEPLPTIEPTTEPTKTFEPTATTEPTATPTPSLTATPSPMTKGFAVQRIASGSLCTQVSGSDTVAHPNSVQFSCGTNAANHRRTISGVTANWEFSLDNVTWQTANYQSSPIGKNSTALFAVYLRPKPAAAAGSVGQVTVSLIGQGGSQDGQTLSTSVLEARTAAPAPMASDLQLICSPATVTRAASSSQEVGCTYSGKASLGTSTVTLTQLIVPAPAGWTITSTAGSVGGTTLTIAPNAQIAFNPAHTYSFTFTLTPACTASTTAQTMNLTSNFSFNSAGYAGATTTVTAARSAAASTVSASVTGSALNWTRAYSFAQQSDTGSLSYRVVASGCSGWNVQISASAFTYSGTASGSGFPSPSLSLSGSGAPTGGSTSGISRPVTSGALSTPLKVLAATATNGVGTYDHTLTFGIAVPGGSPAGTYTSTLTVTAASGP